MKRLRECSVKDEENQQEKEEKKKKKKRRRKKASGCWETLRKKPQERTHTNTRKIQIILTPRTQTKQLSVEVDVEDANHYHLDIGDCDFWY